MNGRGRSKPEGPFARLVGRTIDVRSSERQALLLSAAYFFFVLSAYYIIRPIRDEMAVAGGVRNLPWMFTGTLVLMLLVNPVFAGIVVRFTRIRFISYAYRFFMLNLAIFFVLFRIMTPEQGIWVGRAFYWWTSVFNLFVVSIFWAFMSDVWSTGQSKRLYGFIGVGGTLGAMIGASITGILAQLTAPANLILISVVLLEIAVWAVRRLTRLFEESTQAPGAPNVATEPIGGSVWAGITHVVKSPYLLGICAYILGYTIVGTVLYFQQAEIASLIEDRGDRTSFFGFVDSATNALTIVTQLFLTGRLIKWVGVGIALTILPAFCVIGFTALGFWPGAIVIVVVQVLRRATNFAIARPAKETLYTVVTREDRFKAKALIDTFVYRAGDQVGAWSIAGLGALGLTMSGIAFAAVPVAAVWLIVGYWLGRKQNELLVRPADTDPGASVGAAVA